MKDAIRYLVLHTSGGVWFPRTRPDTPAHVTLTGRRGKPLGVIYLQPIRTPA